MEQDRKLSWLYASSSVVSAINVVCFNLVWLYWTRTLNTCQTSDLDFDRRNCGCILFGVWGEFFFKGGDVTYCYWIGLSSVPVAVWSALLALYHGYRGCCSVVPVRVTLITKNKVKSINTQLWPRWLMICFAIMSIAILALLVVSTFGLTIGYNFTCQQYKKFIVSHLSASGSLAKAIFDRLPCEVSYDLMDYLQPDPVFLDYNYRRGSWVIDTDLLLKFSISSSIVTIILYSIISFLNFKYSQIPSQSEILNTEL